MSKAAKGATTPLIIVAVYRGKPAWKLEERYVEEIREVAGKRFEVFQAASREEIASRLGEAEIVYGFRVGPEDIPNAPRLKWIQATSAGVDGALFGELVERGITLTSAVGIHAIEISEQALATMIALTRQIQRFIRQQEKKTWAGFDASMMGEVYEKTLGIVGLGHIGEALAVRAKALGMRVIGVKNHPAGYKGAADEVYGMADLERVMAASDYVVALLPATPATEGVISRDKIALMKPTAYFLNFGRGSTVDEKALVKALQNGKIAGAGLDVFEEEPLPKKLAALEDGKRHRHPARRRHDAAILGARDGAFL